MDSISNLWVGCSGQEVAADMRLFCLPYAGGNTSIFRSWGEHLSPHIEVCPILLPGRERRLNEPLFTRLGPLIEALTQAIYPYLDIPFALFGHSMGALIGFELARSLRRHYALTPLCLLVSACRAPQLPNPGLPIHRLPNDIFLKKLRVFGGTPEEVLLHEELMQLMLPVLCADFELYETYHYREQPKFACPIFAFGGVHDTIVDEAGLVDWQDQTTGPFLLHMLPGNHFFIQSSHEMLLRKIQEDLLQCARLSD